MGIGAIDSFIGSQDCLAYTDTRPKNFEESMLLQKICISASLFSNLGCRWDPVVEDGELIECLNIKTANQSTVQIKYNRAREEHWCDAQGKEYLFSGNWSNQIRQPIFLVRHVLDALSIEEAGGYAFSLIHNYDNLSEYSYHITDQLLFHRGKHDLKKKEFIVSIGVRNKKELESDAPFLFEKLNELGIKYTIIDTYCGYGHQHEALCKERDTFCHAVRSALSTVSRNDSRQPMHLPTFVPSMADFLSAFQRGECGAPVTPIPTGFQKLDSLLGSGLTPGLITVGAVPSIGKTTFVLQLMDQMAIAGSLIGGGAILFSLEMSRQRLMAKSLSRLSLCECLKRKLETSHAWTDNEILHDYGNINENKAEEILQTAIAQYAVFDKTFIYENDFDVNIDSIANIVEDVKPAIVIIDYLQLLAGTMFRTMDKQSLDRVVIELKKLSSRYGIPIVVISSLGRQFYNMPISLDAPKESGAIEYSSDVFLGMQYTNVGAKDFRLDKERAKNPCKITLKVLKNRFGPVGGEAHYDFYGAYSYFREI